MPIFDSQEKLIQLPKFLLFQFLCKTNRVTQITIKGQFFLEKLYLKSLRDISHKELGGEADPCGKLLPDVRDLPAV